MKKITTVFLTALTLSLVFIISCSKDDPGKTDPLVGKYIISSTVLTQPAMYQGDTVLAAGTDITLGINAALLSSASCSNVSNTRLELKNNGQIWYDCEGENTGIQNGTWEITTDRSSLSLALNIPNPVGTGTITANLTISDLQESALQVSGNTSIPLPASFFAGLGVDVSNYASAIIPTSFEITITRVP
jgi:hypothetical protein